MAVPLSWTISDGGRRKGSSGPCPVKKGKYYWADLLWRVFSVAGFSCPLCGERMKVRAVVTWPPATTSILDCLSVSTRTPVIVRQSVPCDVVLRVPWRSSTPSV